MSECYEIDFIPVGSGKRSGDAICFRYGTPGNYKVVVYDGGTKDSGTKLVQHIRQHYGVEHVDYVVCSHPDADHASGLSVVLEELSVGELWMHRPWYYSSTIRDYFRDGRITDKSLEERLREKMSAAHTLEQIAEEKGIPHFEPFQGAQIGPFYVLSPSKDWYIHELIPAFSKSPEQKAKNTNESWTLKSIFDAASAAVEHMLENWDIETLRESVTTSAENESSVVLFGTVAERGILLMGDAGIQALSGAANYAEQCGVSIPNHVRFAQVPHHGSRNNVSPSVLDRLIGPKLTAPTEENSVTAFVSAAKESETHPRKAVVNAFIRRGAKVLQTKGQSMRHHFKMGDRQGWGPVDPLAFSHEVEAWD